MSATTTKPPETATSNSVGCSGVGTESLTLKWGSLKAWDLKTESSLAALKRYFNSGKVSVSAIAQRDNQNQKAALLELIDAVEGEIWNGWEGTKMTKSEAKEYVSSFGRD